MRAKILAILLTAVVGLSCKAQAQDAKPPVPAEDAKPPLGQAQGPGQATDVPVKSVVLYSSGVGYFEHAGSVHGDGSTQLNFKSLQINDILKSLVLQDMDGGKVGVVTYPSQDPIGKILRSFQVDITGNPPLSALLNQLRGAKVTVQFANEKATGTILGVEQKQKQVGDDKIINVWVLNLISGANIRSIPLDDVHDLQLDDPQLQEELGKALAAVASSRDQEKKPVTINFNGEGDRRVRLGYVVETPIWKTSYRLILGGKDGEKNKLQGWAIIENQTDNDWNDVQLSLVSGRPISFIQDLYQPLYIPRPVVVPELYASLRPQSYEGGMDDGKDVQPLVAAAPGMNLSNSGANMALAGKMKARRADLQAAERDRGGWSGENAPSSPPMDATSSVSATGAASKLGELFEYTVGNVSLPRQKSAMIPIVTDDIEVERLSIYNAASLPKNPLVGARVKNTTGKHLLQGPITVLDANAYAGDAKIDDLPPGQERLLSYGIDLQMKIDSTSNTNESTLQTGKIVKGVLWLTRKNVFTQDYVADNKSDKDKTLIIEHPRRGGWELVETDKPMEVTDSLYRFKVIVPAGKTGKFTVKEQIVQGESIAILPADIGQLDFYSKAGEIPQNVRDVLVKAIGMKQAMVDTERQITERQQRIAEITQEQNRIRENMRTVNQQSQYYNRLLTKLNEQESQIEKLQGEVDDFQTKLKGQREAMESFLTDMSIG